MTSLVIAAAVLIPLNAEGIKPEVVKQVKDATVYLVAEMQRGDLVEQHHGTGYVARRNGKQALIVTNRHIVQFLGPGVVHGVDPRAIAPDVDFSAGLDGDIPGKNPTLADELTVYFRPGTQRQSKSKGTVLFAAKSTDLAIISVDNIDDLPQPIEIETNEKVAELDDVYFFGFPLGPQLAIAGQAPAVTVHKASIGSLKQNMKGQLTCVQINGEVNHGNSGGPLVNKNGKLVGVIYAKVENTQIGAGIATPLVQAMLKPRVLGARIFPANVLRDINGKVDQQSRVKVFLLSGPAPWRSVKFFYRTKELMQRTFATELSRDPSHRTIDLKIEGDLAQGQSFIFTPNNDNSVICQVVATDANGKVYRTDVQELSLFGQAIALKELDPNNKQKKRKTETGSSGLTAKERLARDRAAKGGMEEAKTARERLQKAKEADKKNNKKGRDPLRDDPFRQDPLGR